MPWGDVGHVAVTVNTSAQSSWLDEKIGENPNRVCVRVCVWFARQEQQQPQDSVTTAEEVPTSLAPAVAAADSNGSTALP